MIIPEIIHVQLLLQTRYAVLIPHIITIRYNLIDVEIRSYWTADTHSMEKIKLYQVNNFFCDNMYKNSSQMKAGTGTIMEHLKYFTETLCLNKSR